MKKQKRYGGWRHLWRCQARKRPNDAGIYVDSEGVRRLLYCATPVVHFRTYATVQWWFLEHQRRAAVMGLGEVVRREPHQEPAPVPLKVKAEALAVPLISISLCDRRYDAVVTVAAGPDPFALPKDPKGRFFGDDLFPYPDSEL